LPSAQFPPSFVPPLYVAQPSAATRSVTVAGDLFDIGWRANRRNVRLLREYFEREGLLKALRFGVCENMGPVKGVPSSSSRHTVQGRIRREAKMGNSGC
jgi:hypothetical protein